MWYVILQPTVVFFFRLTNHLSITEDSFTSFSDIYESYVKDSLYQPESKKAVGMEILHRFPTCIKGVKKFAKHQMKGYKNIKLHETT